MSEYVKLFVKDSVSEVIKKHVESAHKKIVEGGQANGKSDQEIIELFHQNLDHLKIKIDFENYTSASPFVDEDESGEKCEARVYSFDFSGSSELFEYRAPSLVTAANASMASFDLNTKKVSIKLLPPLKLDKGHRVNYVTNMLKKHKESALAHCHGINTAIDEAIKKSLKSLKDSLKTEEDYEKEMAQKVALVLKGK